MHRIKNIIRIWLPLAVVTTALCGLAYGLVQQSLRMSLNDPQIQMAEDAASALNNGATLDAITAGSKVEMSASLAPFIVVYDANGKPVSGSGLLNGQLPDYPKGALDAAKQSGDNRVTWQPTSTVRIASIAVPYKDGFVMAGRNMREVESRETNAGNIAFAAWIVTLIAAFTVVAFGEVVLK
jgi:hypothetical protein